MNGMRYYLVTAMLAATSLIYHFAPHGTYLPAHRKLELFPRNIAGLKGQDLPFSAGELSVLGRGEFLQRSYWPTSGGLPILLYVGYYPRQETGETVHSPQNCLPGGGWEVLGMGRISIPVQDGRTIQVNKYLVQRNAERLLVLYWFQGRGRVIASEYWSKFYLVHDAITLGRTDGAIVRVSAPATRSEADTTAYLNKFIPEIYAQLQDFVPR